jgi:hypothetical protein
MKNEPWDAEDYKDRPEMLKLLLMLDGQPVSIIIW